jgi:hypothetical protein
MTPNKLKSICVPLDPDDCGSSISGWVRYPEIDDERGKHNKKQYLNYSADLSLSDCSRVITWSFSNSRDGFDLEKIDRAIGALMTFRQYMEGAEVLRKKLATGVEEHNKLIDEKEDG